MDPTSQFWGRILNVPPDADKETITTASRKRALKYHPDRAGDSSNLKFQHVGAAYEILMSTSGLKGNLCGLDMYAGMSEEDVEWMMNLHRQQRDYSRQGCENRHSEQTSSKPEANASQQEEEDRSVKFSFESDSSSTTDDNALFQECPVCSGPLYRARVCCSRSLFDPPHAARPASVPVSPSSPFTPQQRTKRTRQTTRKSRPPWTSRPCPPSSKTPMPLESLSLWTSMPSLNKVENDSPFLQRFRDHHSTEFLYTDSEVSVLWQDKPRETDEFGLGRGDMLRILSIYDDGWVRGYRLGPRATEWTGVTTGQSSMSRTRAQPGSVVKVFPLVYVTVPWEWKKCVEQDSVIANG